MSALFAPITVAPTMLSAPALYYPHAVETC